MSTRATAGARMDSSRDEVPVDGLDPLTDSLCRMVRDSSKVHHLYELLGPFCHETRNVLNSIKMSLYLAQRVVRPAVCEGWQGLEQDYLAVERLYDRLQFLCRPLPMNSMRMPLDLLMNDRNAAWTDRFAASGGRLELIAPRRPCVGDYDPVCLGQALDAFLSWRAEVIGVGTLARLRWKAKGEDFHVEWTESGTETTRRPDENPSPPTDSREPFALPYLVRVITAHGGTTEVNHASGWGIHLTWPCDAAVSR